MTWGFSGYSNSRRYTPGTNVSPFTVPYPAPAGGILAGEKLILLVGIHKATQAGTEAAATPARWTSLGSQEGGANIATAADVGLCRIYAFHRDAAGGETGNLDVTIDNIVGGNSGTNAAGNDGALSRRGRGKLVRGRRLW